MTQITTSEINERLHSLEDHKDQKSIIIKTSDGKVLWFGTADEKSVYKVAVKALEATYNCQYMIGNADVALHIEID